jgi:predicted ATPase
MAAKAVRAVLTGGPGAGKSTLLEAMRAKDVRIFPEAARVILQSPDGMAIRAERPMDFAMAMLDADLAAWHAADSSLSLYDRGFPDIAGFLELEGLPIPASLERICYENRYNGPIFRASPWLEIYATDTERTQDWNQAVASDEAVTSAWQRYGYQLIDLPHVSVTQRADFVMRQIMEEFDQ